MKTRSHAKSLLRNAGLILSITVLTACGGGGSGDEEEQSVNTRNLSTPELIANNYSAETSSGDAVRIYALDNDIGVHNPSLTVTISSSPSNGSAVVQGDNSIVYTPDIGFTGVDSFEYRISLASGATDTAVVSIEVNDDGFACAYTAGLSWDVSSDPNVAGYFVYHGSAPSTYEDKTYVGLVFNHDYCLSAPGTHYFAASSRNIYGVESALSDEIVVTIP